MNRQRQRRWIVTLMMSALAMAMAACNRGGEGEPTPPPLVLTPPTVAVTIPVPEPTPVSGEGIIDLAGGPPLLTIYGADSHDLESDLPGLASADFNADGLDDILLGARFGDGPDNQREDAGEAYVIFGANPPPDAVDIAANEQGLTIYGAAPGDGLGFSAAAADVNGDTIADILVGAPSAVRPDRPQDKSGIVYLVFGRADLGGSIDLASAQPDATILGPRSLGLFGDSLATGDVNGDGLADIIIGAPFAEDMAATPLTYDTGAAYVVFGSPRLRGTIDLAEDEFDLAIFGVEPQDELGDTVASGDLNGDGFDDIVAAAEAADGPENARDGAGEVYVIFGSPALKGVFHIEEGDQDVTVLGADSPDTLGFSLAAADLNGDQVDDLILGARLANGPANTRSTAGEAYVLFGGDLAPLVDIAQGEQDVTVYGAEPADLLGNTVGAGDVDGDGRNDLLLGIGFADGPHNQRLDSGEVYVLTDVASGSFDTGKTLPSFIMFGARPDDRLGSSLATADINGDGRQELVLVAQDADGPAPAQKDGGAVFVVTVGP